MCSDEWALSHSSHSCTIRGLLLHLYLIHADLPAVWQAQQMTAERNSTSFVISVSGGEGKNLLIGSYIL